MDKAFTQQQSSLDMQKEYFTRKEAAEFLRLSVRSLDQKAAEGEIPYYKLGNSSTSRVLYGLTDLKKYIEQYRVEI